ncbi:MAG: hypothetical protein IKD00_00585 [Candidatus Methanomethylophilaceae archaeon]|nr:hypothetical protein [Candidatus Methanomethylophilaceae archaeon]
MNRRLLEAVVLIVAVSAFVLLSASSVDAADNEVVMESEHGTVVDASTGREYDGGRFQNELKLAFQSAGGYEFVKWTVEGDCQYETSLNTITIKSVTGKAVITPEVRNYSSSQGLVNIIDVDDLLGVDDEIVNNWSFASDKLVRVGSNWIGMPSVPLVVGDYLYVRAGEMLYSIDIDSGTAVRSVQSLGGVDFYHYLSYGGGVIFDTVGNKAFDLDLNYLYDIPSNLAFATYHNGYFYGFITNGTDDAGRQLYSIYKTSLDVDKDLSNGVKVNLCTNKEKFLVFNQYGQFSSFISQDGWLFFLQADQRTGTVGYRAITAFDTVTERSVTCELTGFTGMPWDDGWLTHHNGYFYLTAYTAGLFDGVIGALEDKRSSLMWVKFDFDKGEFGVPKYQNIMAPDGSDFRGIASGLVCHGDRGYLNVRASPEDTMGSTNDVGTCMISFDIRADGTPIPKEAAGSYMTHGGIVVNVAHEDDGIINIYLIPYDSHAQGIYIFTDRLVGGEWVMDPKFVKKYPTHTEWCSQGIHAGPNGEIMYYVDRGYIDCYIPASSNWITVFTMDSETAVSQSATGANAGKVIEKLYPSAFISDGKVTIGSKTYVIYGLNEVGEKWNLVTDPYTELWTGTENNGTTVAMYRYIILLEEGSQTHFYPWYDNGWYYLEDGGYVKCVITDYESIDAALGKTLRYFSTSPNGLILPNSVTVPHEGSVTVEVSKTAQWTFSMTDSSIASAVKDGNDSLVISYVAPGQTTVTVSADGKDYPISVTVLRGAEIDDGYTVNTSERTEPTSDGGSKKTVVTSKVKDTETIVTTETTVYGPNGAVKGSVTETVINDREYDRDQDGNVIALIQKDYVERDASGSVIKSTLYGSETVQTTNVNGDVIVKLLEVSEDRLTNTLVTTETVTTTGNAIVKIESTVKTETSSGITTESSVRVESALDTGTEAFIEDGKVVVELVGEKIVNFTAMGEALDPELPIVVRAGPTVLDSNIMTMVDAGAVLECTSGVGTITLDTEVLERLQTRGILTFSAVKAAAKDLSSSQKEVIGSNLVFDINMVCGDVPQEEFGTFTMTVDCKVVLQDGETLKVWRVDSDGTAHEASDVVYSDGRVSFTADHLSMYAVGTQLSTPSEDGSGSGGDDIMLYVGIAAVVVIAALVAVFMIRRRSA